MAVLKRDVLVRELKRTGGVIRMPDGRLIRREEDLPPEEELAAGDQVRLAEVREDLLRQAGPLLDRLSRLSVAESGGQMAPAQRQGMIPEEDAKRASDEKDKELQRLRAELETLRSQSPSPPPAENPLSPSGQQPEGGKQESPETSSEGESSSESSPGGRSSRSRR